MLMPVAIAQDHVLILARNGVVGAEKSAKCR